MSIAGDGAKLAMVFANPLFNHKNKRVKAISFLAAVFFLVFGFIIGAGSMIMAIKYQFGPKGTEQFFCHMIGVGAAMVFLSGAIVYLPGILYIFYDVLRTSVRDIKGG